MLELLHIENVAVIERADIPFAGGLNVLTGETGAGKSIIIDAIGAILGGRASRELVRSGAAAARITAELSPSEAALSWLRDNEIDFEPGENILVTRRIQADGKSSCRLNGAPVTLAQLRELGERLFDVYGQNDGRRLLSESSHRACLDGFGALQEPLGRYQEAYRAYLACKSRVEELERRQEDKDYLAEKLKKEIRLLTAAAPRDGETEALQQRVKRLQFAEKLTDQLTRAYECLCGGEHGLGAADQLVTAAAALEATLRVDESYSSLAAEAADLRFRAEDLGERLADARRELDYSPGELDRLEERLSLLERLVRKYGSEQAARDRLAAARNELEDVSDLDGQLQKAAQAMKRRKAELLELGQALREARQQAAACLEPAVERELAELRMPGARFRVELAPKGGSFDSGGLEEVRFLLAANAGQAPGRLSRIASGGELSRIMLALKNVLRMATDPEVLIFDEIDTGVSGIAAQRVGEKLARLARSGQVLCVTHLPQLAAMGDAQFCIRKQERNGNTFTEVERLDAPGRERELARLMGGETVTDITLQSAAQLIAAADRWKAENR